jgi:hypothetical protein
VTISAPGPSLTEPSLATRFDAGVVGLPMSTIVSPRLSNQSLQSFKIAALSSGVGGDSRTPPVYTSRKFATAVPLLCVLKTRHMP